jgi:hypothetical protein
LSCGNSAIRCLGCDFIFDARALSVEGLCSDCRGEAPPEPAPVVAQAEAIVETPAPARALVSCGKCGGVYDLATAWVQIHGSICRRCAGFETWRTE